MKGRCSLCKLDGGIRSLPVGKISGMYAQVAPLLLLLLTSRLVLTALLVYVYKYKELCCVFLPIGFLITAIRDIRMSKPNPIQSNKSIQQVHRGFSLEQEFY